MKHYQKYKIIFKESNSELDYGFLVNALHNFEEKYPSILIRYKNDPEFIKKLEKMEIEDIKHFNIWEEKDSTFKSENTLVLLEPKIQNIKTKKNIKITKIIKEVLSYTKNRALLKNNRSINIKPGIVKK